MPSIGSKFPVVSNSQSFPTGSAWTSSSGTSDVLGPSDGSYFYTTISSGASSRTLRCGYFGFGSAPVVPLGVTIDGIQIDITLASSGASAGISDSVIQLLQGDTSTAADRVGSNKALGTAMPTSGGATRTYGGSTDLWGTSWTPSQIRSGLGIDLVFVKSAGSSGTIYIDSVIATVWYTLPPIVGSAALLDKPETLSASVTLKIIGAAALTDLADALAAAASSLATATATLTDGVDYLLPPIAGSAALVDEPDAFAAIAAAKIGVAAPLVDGPETLICVVTVRVAGAAALNDGADLMLAAAAAFFFVPPSRVAIWTEKGTRFVTARPEKPRTA